MGSIDLNAVGMGKTMLTSTEMDVSEYLGEVDFKLDLLTLAVTKGDLSIYDGVDGLNTAVGYQQVDIENMTQQQLMQLLLQNGAIDGKSSAGMSGEAKYIQDTYNFLKNNPNLSKSQVSSKAKEIKLNAPSTKNDWIYKGIDPASTSGMFLVSQWTDKFSKMTSAVSKAVKTMIDIAKNFARKLD